MAPIVPSKATLIHSGAAGAGQRGDYNSGWLFRVPDPLPGLMPVCPACHREYDPAESLASVCPLCGAVVPLEGKDDPDTTTEFDPVDKPDRAEESATVDFDTDDFEPQTVEITGAGDDADERATLELPASDDASATVDESATVDLGLTVAGDDSATIEFGGEALGDGSTESDLDATLDLPEKPPTTPIDADVTIDLAPADSAALGSSWAAAAKASNNAGQTLRADPSKTVGQTVGGFRSSLPIKARSLQQKSTDTDPSVQPTPDAPAPDYELIDMLGQGGMGVVYAAKQSSIARTVAVKMLRPGGKGSTEAGSEDQRDKFISEAVITGELEHPNIVPIYDLGANAEGALFYSMKRVKGTPWDEAIARKSVTENLGILMRVADAIAFAHASGVIHRDLKPENTMLGDYGEVLVMDWGLARVTEGFPSASSVHQSDSLGGTPTYMSPEMARGPINEIDPRSDIYLLGAILFEICVGKPPHTGKDVMDCLMAAATNRIRPVDERIERKHPELLAIARKAMAAKKEDRYQSVKEMQAAIQEHLSHAESVALAASAENSLAEARESGQYDLFSRALYGFEEALALWAGNERASETLHTARLEYARIATDNGDYDLAESLLNAGDADSAESAELLGRLVAARDERNARQQRLRTLKRLAVGLLFAVVAITSVAYFEIRRQKNAAVEQKQIAEEQRSIAEQNEEEAIAQKQIAEEQRSIAESQKTVAEEQRALAEQQEQIAVAEREEADRQRTVAEQQREAAVAARQAEQVQRRAAEQAKKNEAYEAYLARIGLAAAKIDENAFDEARALLDACPAELRHWEWGRLRYLCGLAADEYPSDSPVTAVAYSPDGHTHATGNQAGELSLRTDDQPRSVQVGVSINAISFSPSGQTIAIACGDAIVYLYDSQTLERTRSLVGHTEGVLSADFSSNGSQLVTAGYDQTVRVWDPTSGDELYTLRGHTWWVWSARFNTRSDRIVSTGHDGRAIVWRRSNAGFEPLTEFSEHEGAVYAADFGADGKVASAGYDRTIRVWDPEAVQPTDIERRVAGLPDPPTPHAVLTGHQGPVRTVRFGNDGQTLLSGSYDNSLRLWRLDDNTGWSVARTLRGHGGRVNEVAISPDGRTAISAGDDERTLVWELGGDGETQVLRTTNLQGHEDALLSATFSPDGERIVTASRDRSAKVWDTSTGNPIATLAEGHEFLATRAILCQEGRTLATIGGDGAARVWDIAAGVERYTLAGAGRNAALAVSDQGGWIATGSDTTTVQIYSLDAGTPNATLIGHPGTITALAASDDGLSLASGDDRGVIRVWNKTDEKWTLAYEMRGHSAAVTALRFHPNGGKLISASGDYTCGQWDLASGEEINRLMLKHPDWVTAMDVSPNGELALTAASDGVVRLWKLDDATLVATTTLDNAVATSVAFSSSGNEALLAAASSNLIASWSLGSAEPTPLLRDATGPSAVWSAAYGPIEGTIVVVGGNGAQLWRRDPSMRVMRFSTHGAVADAAVSPDGRTIATASWDGSVKLWNAADGQPIRRIDSLGSGYLNRVRFTADGAGILTASDDGTARLTTLADASTRFTLKGHNGRVLAATIDNAGNLIATGGADSRIVLWSAETGEKLRELVTNTAVLSVSFSPDGALLASGSEDSSAAVWAVGAGEQLHRLSAHTAGVTSVGFSPDGARLVTGSRDSAARIWDVRTGKEVLALNGHEDEVTHAEFHPDGHSVLTASRDGRAIVWPTTDWAPQQQR